MSFDSAQELLEILDGNPARVPAAGDPRQIGLGQLELGHARAHPRRKIARAFGASRNRQHARLIDLEMRTRRHLRQSGFIDLKVRTASVLGSHGCSRFLFAARNFLGNIAFR